jgi:hypothetical protein
LAGTGSILIIWSIGHLVIWSVGQVVGWSGGRLVGWSVGQVVQLVRGQVFLWSFDSCLYLSPFGLLLNVETRHAWLKSLLMTDLSEQSYSNTIPTFHYVWVGQTIKPPKVLPLWRPK